MFQSDVTPPLGSTLCPGNVQPAKEIVDRLTARGIILLTVHQHDTPGIDFVATAAWRTCGFSLWGASSSSASGSPPCPCPSGIDVAPLKRQARPPGGLAPHLDLDARDVHVPFHEHEVAGREQGRQALVAIGAGIALEGHAHQVGGHNRGASSGLPSLRAWSTISRACGITP